jgi:hypothetical protein
MRAEHNSGLCFSWLAGSQRQRRAIFIEVDAIRLNRTKSWGKIITRRAESCAPG